ncbi:MAG: cation transporter [Gemmatimonadales bacterium]
MTITPEQFAERRVLQRVLAINAGMFVIELMASWWGDSIGLLADSLDMLADAAVYGLALAAVSRSTHGQARAASISGALQIILGAGALLEALRRFATGSQPEGGLMMAIGLLALVANVACLFLLAPIRRGRVHLRAAWIFSTNDVLANVGVMTSGLLVGLLGSRIPDIAIASVIAVIVVRGGIRIRRDASATLRAAVQSPE